jgi:peptidoglycan-associated lipoprotein
MKSTKLALAIVILGSGLLMSGCAAKGGISDGVTAEYGTTDTNGDGIGLGTLQRVYFEFDRSEITGETAKVLKNNASTIKKTPSMKVLVEGHCDERGTNEYNIALGERRGRALVDYLVSLGVGRNRLEMKSWGEEKPIDSGHGEDAWSKNRRGEFIILAK